MPSLLSCQRAGDQPWTTTIFPPASLASMTRCASWISSKPNTRVGLAFRPPGRHLLRDLLQRYVGQRETRRAEHETAKEGEVDAARHLQQRVEVLDRRQPAQPTREAGAAAPAQHGEGIEDGAVADQVEHGVEAFGLGDALGKVRPLSPPGQAFTSPTHSMPITFAASAHSPRRMCISAWLRPNALTSMTT
jgi:hypothetical protein